jgi:mRNA-degrading endonuclease toxin of MazEF toxin-antitoxin module
MVVCQAPRQVSSSGAHSLSLPLISRTWSRKLGGGTPIHNRRFWMNFFERRCESADWRHSKPPSAAITTVSATLKWRKRKSGASSPETISLGRRMSPCMFRASATNPQRGEIWFTKLPTDPPKKGKRPVVIVSVDARNNHPRANTVLVVPLSTSRDKSESPTHVLLESRQTGLRERSVAKAENVATISKILLERSRERLRPLSSTQVCDLARKVQLAMGCLP